MSKSDYLKKEEIEDIIQPSTSPVESISVESPTPKNPSIGIQVSLKPHFRSKMVQATPSTESIEVGTKRPFYDDLEENIPKKARSDSESVPVSVSEWTVNSASPSTPSSNSPSADAETLELRLKNLEVTIRNIALKPQLYLGITPPVFDTLKAVCDTCSLLPRNVMIILKKLRLNLPMEILADDFGLSLGQISKIFSTDLPKLASEFKTRIYWPKKNTLKDLVPKQFRMRYQDVDAIIDCFEVRIEKPSNPLNQALTWSENKKSNTFKYLISCTPYGFINFVSRGYGGRYTDTNITQDCGFLDNLSPGSKIMAYRGFKGLVTTLQSQSISLICPPSVRAGEKLTKQLSIEAKRIASLRTHVEQVIGRIRNYKFIAADTTVDSKLIPYLDAAVIVICGLLNLQKPHSLK